MRILCPDENEFVVFKDGQASVEGANGERITNARGSFCVSTTAWNTQGMREFMYDVVWSDTAPFFLKTGYLMIYGWRAADNIARELDRS